MTYGSSLLKREKFNDGQWTLGRFNSFVTSILRSGSRRWGPKYTTLAEACVGVKTNKKTGRQAKHYTCNACRNEFVSADVEVDHIIPIGTEKTWDEFIDGLFCEKDNLQVLCKECHAKKTKKEKAK